MPSNAQKIMHPGDAELDRNWRRWVAENLLLDIDRRQIVDVLLRAGFDQGLIEQELRSAEQHPYLLAARRLRTRLAKQHWTMDTLGQLEKFGSTGIERRETIDPRAFFEEFYARNRPLILTRAIEHWRALSVWSLDYLEKAVKPAIVEIQGGRSADRLYEQRSENYKHKVSWQVYLAALGSGRRSNDYYLTANNGMANRDVLKPLWRDFGPIDGIVSGNPHEQGFLWLGPPGTITPWHHDLTNNLLVQIMGHKKITLASPAQTPRMRNHCHCYSAFGQDAACQSAHTNERPHLLHCELAPGDLIFLPIGWWHHVEALDLSASLTLTNFEGPNEFYKSYPSFDAL